MMKSHEDRRAHASGSALLGALLGGALACTPAASSAPAAPSSEQRLCDALPPRASEQLQASLVSSRSHARHIWRDVPPFNADGTLNGYVEIPLGERHKWEFDIGANQLRLDRMLDESVSGYPINYGFVPQTVSCDGDPFDVLVLGPAIPPGTLISGTIVGVMYMDDEKGPDGKVIIAPSVGPGDAPLAPTPVFTPELEAELQRWFDAYKKPDAEQGRWSAVRGFGGAADGRRLVESTHRFYEEGLARSARP